MRVEDKIEVVIARQLFNAYNDQPPNPWQTFDGRPVPKWEELSDQVRAKWTASAARAIELIPGIGR